MTTPTDAKRSSFQRDLDIAIGELLAAVLVASDLDAPAVVTAHCRVSRAIAALVEDAESRRPVDGVDVAQLQLELERHRSFEAELKATCTGHNCLPSFEWKQCSDGWKERCLQAEEKVRQLRRQVRDLSLDRALEEEFAKHRSPTRDTQ